MKMKTGFIKTATFATLLAAVAFAYASGPGDFACGEIIRQMNGRTCLVGDSVLVGKVQEYAKEKGVALDAVPLGGQSLDSGKEPAWKAAAREMAGGDKRILSAIEFGPLVFVRSLMRFKPESAVDKIALFILPDLWEVEGIRTVPSGMVFLGTLEKNLQPQTLDALLESQRELWSAAGDIISSPGTKTTADVEWIAFLRRQISWNANNLGIAFERLGEKEKAYECYTRAGLLSPRNISALLNRAVSVKRGVHPELSEQMGNELGKLGNSGADVRELWNLSQMHGYVFSPEEFFRFGWFWAASGISCADTNACEAVLAKIPENETEILRRVRDSWTSQTAGTDMLAAVAADLDIPEKRGEAAYSAAAAFMIGRDFEKSEKWADTAAAAGVPPAKIAMLRSSIMLLKGNRADAKAILIQAAAEEPDSLEIGTTFVTLCYEDNDRVALKKFIAGVTKENAEKLAYPVKLAEGVLDLYDGKPGIAREKLGEAIKLNPSLIPAYDIVLPLDFQANDRKTAEIHADALLKIVPGHAFANYIKGSIALEKKDLKQAEKYFVRSLSSRQTLAALNDYACLLLEQKRGEDAEKAAKAAIDNGGSKLAAVWDTLAAAQLMQNKTEEADKSLDEAAKADGADSPEIQLNIARSLLRRGDTAGAKAAAEKARAKRYLMGPEKRNELLKIQRKISGE